MGLTNADKLKYGITANSIGNWTGKCPTCNATVTASDPTVSQAAVVHDLQAHEATAHPDTDRHDREYVPSMANGMALFEAGVTIDAADRFRERCERANVPYDRTDELVSYFKYERDSLRLYAMYLEGVREPRPVPECPNCLALGNSYGMLVSWGSRLVEGVRRCIRCGRHYDVRDASKPKEIAR